MTGNRSGRHFLQIPGPTNVPDRVLRAIQHPTIDHRGPRFQQLARDVLDRLRLIFKTDSPIVIFPSSGTGAWEAALVNTMSAGDKVLMYETGHFASLWYSLAERLGLDPQLISGDWRSGVDADTIQGILERDSGHKIKAVCVVHNETSTGVTSDIPAVRHAIDSAGHSALLMVDTISSLASIDYRHDEWGVDVTVAGSQKGLMLPPGLGFNAVSEKALSAAEKATLPRAYWSWAEVLETNQTGFFPYTPATNLLMGLQEAIEMLLGEGLENVFSRHMRFGEATRRAVQAWGLELLCLNSLEFSNSLTAVVMPETINADDFRRIVLERFDMSLGNGLGQLAGKVFRIGHLGDFNDLMLMATLSGIEMTLDVSAVPHKKGGVQAAIDYIGTQAQA
ncbi:MAG: aminotransferase class V-fold PLP-dependent enzyme [Pseudomonadota bacterium]|nr:aminotransferase class V-fold PLP-dependent enzyme [Pseudomonadota bacterium]